jgi:Flp pilus assembly protein TadG
MGRQVGSTEVGHRHHLRGDGGQSLVEIALALPLLLLILVGLADLGRAFYYTTAVASAARQGASYVASTASPDPSTLTTKACRATGFDPAGNCGAALQATNVTNTTGCDGAGPSASGTVAVQVTYDLHLISGYLVNRIFPLETVTLRACATYPSLTS